MARQIVFLCAGNTCRSPLAEALAARIFQDLRLRFASAGLEAVAGLPASPASAEWAATRGLDLAGHGSQAVTPALLAETAWVIAMTRAQAAIFRSRYAAVFSGSLGVLGAPGLDLAARGESPLVAEVNDPYGLPRERYFECGEQIDRLLREWGPVFAELSGGPQPTISDDERGSGR